MSISNPALDFVSVAKLLKNAGHRGVEIKDRAVSEELFGTRSVVTWFPDLGIVVHNNNNESYQLKYINGKWLKRKSRMVGWYAISPIVFGFYEAMKESLLNIIESE